MSQGQNTPEYRRAVRRAAGSFIPVLLESARRPVHVKDIYARFREQMPHICDDSVKCQCGHGTHPAWEHQVSWALQTLRHKQIVKNARRGFWKLA